MPVLPVASPVQIADLAGRWPTMRLEADGGTWPHGTTASRTGAREAQTADDAACHVRDVLADMMQCDPKR